MSKIWKKGKLVDVHIGCFSGDHEDTGMERVTDCIIQIDQEGPATRQTVKKKNQALHHRDQYIHSNLVLAFFLLFLLSFSFSPLA